VLVLENSSSKKNYLFMGIIVFLLSLCIIAFIVIANELQKDALVQFDRTIISFVQGNISPFLTRVMEGFTFLGSVKWVGAAVVLIALVLFAKRKWSLGLFILLSTGVGTLFNVILKNIFKRQRPEIHRIISESGYSFPSGHSTGAFIFYGSIAYLILHYTNKRGWQLLGVIIIALLILAIGLSRIYLGVHYPSDVIGGYSAGGVWLIICILVFRYYENRKNL